MTQHTRGRFHYPLPQVKDAQLLLRDATGTLLSTIPIDSAEWYGWLKDHTHQSFSYQTPTGAITLSREIKRRGSYWFSFLRQLVIVLTCYGVLIYPLHSCVSLTL